MTCDEARDFAPAFVLGALERADETAVRDHLATCAEPHEEFGELGGVVPWLLEDFEPIEPSAALKGRIMAAAAADLEAAPAVPARPIPIERGIAARETRRGLGVRGSWIAAIAAGLAIVLLGGWNLLLQGQLGEARDYQTALATVLNLAAAPDSETAVLRPTSPRGPKGLAAIGADGHLELALTGLGPTTGDEVYQAWVIDSRGTPVAVGRGFVVGSNGVGQISTRRITGDRGVTVAVTREPGPGATIPTEPILSVGVAGLSTNETGPAPAP